MSVLTRINTVYNHLKPVQRIIADYFLGVDFNSLNVSIEEVAHRTGTSVASVSRFCKRLGFESFQHLKMSISRELKYEPDTVLPIFSMNDNPELSIRKVFAEAVSNLRATEQTVSFDFLIRVTERIIKTRKLYFFGLGGSGKAGEIGEIWFSHIGYTTKAVIDPYQMIVSAGHSNPDYNILALSHTGATSPVIEAVEIARSNGAFTVGITNYSSSPLANSVDVVLLTACPERRVHFAQSNSMIAQFTIIRSIYIIAAVRSNREIGERVNFIEESVNTRLRKKIK